VTSAEGGIFVVHEHHAHHLHYDLRLEREGVLKSWAVPKGIPDRPGVRHLAVETVDHPLSYKDFSGEIPAGEYGAGTVSIWDSGLYRVKYWGPEKIEFVALGEKMHGLYVLIRFRKGGSKTWLLLYSSALSEKEEPHART
jgi:bifunctional non-homologous end joining protein LigD